MKVLKSLTCISSPRGSKTINDKGEQFPMEFQLEIRMPFESRESGVQLFQENIQTERSNIVKRGEWVFVPYNNLQMRKMTLQNEWTVFMSLLNI